MSPSGKAHGFGPCIRGFESLHPSQIQELELSSRIQAFLFANNKETRSGRRVSFYVLNEVSMVYVTSRSYKNLDKIAISVEPMREI